MITPTVTIRPAEGTSVVVTATFVAPVSPDVVSVVTFVLLNENGAVVSTMSVTVESGATSASMTLPALPEGGQVIAYSANAAGVSPNAPAGTNILNRPTGTKRRADGTVVLIGKKIADSVIFDADSPRLDKADLRILDGVVSYVASNGGTVLVSGFARRNGTDSFEYLKNLSLSRARNVSEYLSERGVRVWIRFEGYGPATRVVGTPGDRRVEVRWTLEPPTALT
jgi:outer membrane protein OmpA-like peptidoglycan-associated protein